MLCCLTKVDVFQYPSCPVPAGVISCISPYEAAIWIIQGKGKTLVATTEKTIYKGNYRMLLLSYYSADIVYQNTFETHLQPFNAIYNSQIYIEHITATHMNLWTGSHLKEEDIIICSNLFLNFNCPSLFKTIFNPTHISISSQTHPANIFLCS